MIIDHGEWELYEPDPYPEGLPGNIMFARRIGDHADWYQYQKTKPFKPNSVVMTVQRIEDGEIVQAATRDYTAIFPAGMRMIEETEYAGKKPQNELGQRYYSADLRKISDKRREPDGRATGSITAAGNAARDRA